MGAVYIDRGPVDITRQVPLTFLPAALPPLFGIGVGIGVGIEIELFGMSGQIESESESESESVLRCGWGRIGYQVSVRKSSASRGVRLSAVNSGLDEREFSDSRYLFRFHPVSAFVFAEVHEVVGSFDQGGLGISFARRSGSGRDCQVHAIDTVHKTGIGDQ